MAFSTPYLSHGKFVMSCNGQFLYGQYMQFQMIKQLLLAFYIKYQAQMKYPGFVKWQFSFMSGLTATGFQGAQEIVHF